MKLFLLRLIFVLIATCSSANANDYISADALFQSPSIIDMKLSPNGQFVLKKSRNATHHYLTLIDTSTFKKYRVSEQKQDDSFYFHGAYWLDNETIYLEESESNSIIKIFHSEHNLDIEWHPIEAGGYLVSTNIDENGMLLFSHTDDGEDYDLYELSLDDLIKNKISFLQRTFKDKSGAQHYTFDKHTQSLICYSYEGNQIQYWYLKKGQRSWTKLFQPSQDSKFTPVGFMDDKTLAVLSNKNSNFVNLFEFNIETQTFGAVLYEHNSTDLVNAKLTKQGNVHSVTFVRNGFPITRYVSHENQILAEKLSKQLDGLFVSIAAESSDATIKLILAYQSDTPGELYIYNNQTELLKGVAHVRENLRDYTLSKSEVFYVTHNDGTKIEAIVTKPIDESNGILLVNPHGGPVGVRNTASFNLSNQFFASRGYTILNVNFRGSSGFGKSFKDQGRGQFGQLIEQDITAAYNAFTKTNNFDYVCAMGGSYGGYSAMMLAIQHPEDYQCVIAYFGIFDLPHLFNATNYSLNKTYRSRIERVIGPYSKSLKDVSPVYLVDKLQAPVLLMAGEEDKVAPFEQSNRMKVALETNGKKVEYYVFDETGHGHNSWSGEKQQHDKIEAFIEESKAEYDKKTFYKLVEAIRSGDVSSFRANIGQLKNISESDENGWTLLHYASASKLSNVRIIDFLLQHGANIDAVSYRQKTPLYLAVLSKQLAKVKFLLNEGAYLNKRLKNNWTAFYRAVSQGSVDMVKLMIKRGVNVDIRLNNLGWQGFIFATNISHNAKDVDQAKIISLLAGTKANIEAKTSSGLTAFLNAAGNGRVFVLKALVKAGADIYAVNEKDNNHTAMYYALSNGHNNVVEYLKSLYPPEISQ